MTQALQLNANIFEIIEEYNNKVVEIPELFNEIVQQCEKLENLCCTMGTYSGTVFYHKFNNNNVSHALKSLRKSSWRFVYESLNISDIAPKTHIKHFETLLEDPPEFTSESIFSVFNEYVTDPRGMIIRAFAEIFCSLDKFYKSHSNVKIGVKGLPKRIIISGLREYSFSSGYERVVDVVNCLMRYRGEYDKCVESNQIVQIINDNGEYHGLKFKGYQNGNCHIIFEKSALNDINRALAEYYGEMLPDAYDHTDKKETSREVSKDLQFYRTPNKAVNWFMNKIYFKEGESILEPSCGDGALLDGIRNRISGGNGDYRNGVKGVLIVGVEYDQSRCEQSRQKGYTVHHANFLTWQTREKFDKIIMNPPFYGKHYVKHIDRAYEFLVETGTIYAILPITARLNHGILDEKYDCKWCDLPFGSFSESGTNINTCMVRISK